MNALFVDCCVRYTRGGGKRNDRKGMTLRDVFVVTDRPSRLIDKC
jgi:hypothetical protein